MLHYIRIICDYLHYLSKDINPSDYKRNKMGNLFSQDDYVPMEIRQENNIYMYHNSIYTD